MRFRRFLGRRKGAGERGQGLVEFALIAPILLILMFAIVDFGMGFSAWIQVTNSAREGARLGAVRASESLIETRVRETVDLPDEDANLSISVENAQGDPGESVVVAVGYEYNLITPLAGIVQFVSGNSIGPTLAMEAEADMRLE
ncbi:MAG: pilus assembly protein [Chloroflexi bacterium]|nr:pilus assembly protein [Chloroflexota bacterium]